MSSVRDGDDVTVRSSVREKERDACDTDVCDADDDIDNDRDTDTLSLVDSVIVGVEVRDHDIEAVRESVVEALSDVLRVCEFVLECCSEGENVSVWESVMFGVALAETSQLVVTVVVTLLQFLEPVDERLVLTENVDVAVVDTVTESDSVPVRESVNEALSVAEAEIDSEYVSDCEAVRVAVVVPVKLSDSVLLRVAEVLDDTDTESDAVDVVDAEMLVLTVADNVTLSDSDIEAVDERDNETSAVAVSESEAEGDKDTVEVSEQLVDTEINVDSESDALRLAVIEFVSVTSLDSLGELEVLLDSDELELDVEVAVLVALKVLDEDFAREKEVVADLDADIDDDHV